MNQPAAAKRPSVFSNRDFVLLFFGSSISAIGDTFTLVALPWLVLKLTHDPAAVGLAALLQALPRALFMFVGGAVVDRSSPRRILLMSRAVNCAFVAVLAVLVVTGKIQMWEVYAISLGIGLSTAFVYPAGSAILPQLVEKGHLQAANGLIMGMRQVAMIVGPILAGLLVAADITTSADQRLADAGGMGLAFSIDTVSFLFSLVSLWMIRVHSDYHPPKAEGHILGDVWKGFTGVWADVQLRAFISYVGIVSLFVGGPVQVGLPVLADDRLSSAAAFGILMTSYGLGMLAGNGFSVLVTRAARGHLGLMILSLDTIAGILFALMGEVHSTLMGSLLLAVVGSFAGIGQVALMSWIQQRVPQAMMGRTMSILFFTFLGVGPLSAAVAGLLLKVISLTQLFTGAGISLSVIALLCMTRPALRNITLAARAKA
ncbi:MAG TPA: MFS transporter [Gammaproteobacteria bacterium]|nr:MFS transporter [Gammaproteobacteria bacterium]